MSNYTTVYTHTNIEKLASMKVFDMLPRKSRDKINNSSVGIPYSCYLTLFSMLKNNCMAVDINAYVQTVLDIQAKRARVFVENDLAKLHTNRVINSLQASMAPASLR